MSHFILPRRLFLLVLVLTVFASAAAPVPGIARAQGGPEESQMALAADVPIQVFPGTTVPIKRMVFIWTEVANATQYQVQVNQGATLIKDRFYETSFCAGGTCNVRLGRDLANGGYSWRIRALVAGSWRAYSPWMGFNVSAASSGFSSPFTSDAVDWVVHRGDWYLESSNYFTTVGVSGKVASISHINNYSTLNYEVRMLRNGCAGCANVIIVRGNPSLDATGWWNTEYTFDYTNSGLFSVWKDYYGSYVALKNWTYTTAIDQNDWNTMRVTADGSGLKFYINGILVWSGTDSAYSSGRVGIGMYRNTTTTGNKLYVDYATLQTSVPSATMMEAAETVDASGVEISGGDRNMAPEVEIPAAP